MAGVFSRIVELTTRGAAYVVLLDPDACAPEKNASLAEVAEGAGADLIFVGGSLSLSGGCSDTVAAVKAATSLPVVVFPGNAGFVAEGADALLFLSLVSGRNPQFLIGEHVLAAPAVKRLGLETIPTAYMLVGGGRVTSVEFMSGTRPLPRHKPDIAMAHALAAQYLGMKLAFFDAGSGALKPVPPEIISAVSEYVDIPVMVGGGIRDPENASRLVAAGARLLVTGDVFERTGDAGLVRALAEAVHAS